jgi:hypothetical protein
MKSQLGREWAGITGNEEEELPGMKYGGQGMSRNYEEGICHRRNDSRGFLVNIRHGREGFPGNEGKIPANSLQFPVIPGRWSR